MMFCLPIFCLPDAETENVNLADSLKTTTEKMISELVEDPNTFFTDLGLSALHFLLKVIAAMLIYLIGIWIIRSIKRAMAASFARKNTEKTVASFITSIITISLSVLLFIVTIGTLGVNTTSFAAVLAAGGMAIGMALSGTVQNFAGGMMILIFKPFKVGDFITAKGCTGTVMEVSMVNTKLQTIDNRIIYLPNGDLFNSSIDNFSVNRLRRVEWTVSVGYNVDAEACMDCIRTILKSDARVLDATTEGAAEPVVMLSSLNSSDISFLARAWVNSPDYWDVFYAMNLRFYTELPKAGFGFAYPHMNVSLLQK